MSKSQENLVKNNNPCPTTSKPKIRKNYCCIQEYNQLRNNLKTLQTITQNQTSVDKQSMPSNSKSKIMDSQKHKGNTSCEPLRNNSKTWFQVLQDSPNEETTAKISKSTEERHQQLSNCANLRENNDPKGLTLSLEDEKFLKTLVRINDLIQSECDDVRKASRTHQNISITDDDKFKTYMGKKLQEQSREQKEKQNLQAKALVKLLHNMQAVSKNSELQRETLDKLTRQVVQLREENKILEKLKEVRNDLESKLVSLSAENLFLKKQLQTVEQERDKANNLLEAKEKEINLLKEHITAIKGKIATKLDSEIRYDLDDRPFEFNLEDTFPNMPSNNESFDAPIRPASSSPTEEVLQKWKKRSSNGRPVENNGFQPNIQDDQESPGNGKAEATIRTQVLSNLKNNVKKTVEEFELDMKFNDVSLNLSDATYRMSI